MAVLLDTVMTSLFKRNLYLSLLTGFILGVPQQPLSNRQAAGAQIVVYWGQNGDGIMENSDLSAYCTATSGIDILVLACLKSLGDGNEIPSGTIGQSCYISTSGQGQNCEALATVITTCQSGGIKVILSLGGAFGSWPLSSNAEAEAIGTYLWNSHGNSGNTSVQRPFGSTLVDGFDFDIEVPTGQAYYPALISTLRAALAEDVARTYYITGAPQCPLPEPNMGAIIAHAAFDDLWPQFYNNSYTYPCALPLNSNAALNYDQWIAFTAGTPSAAARLFIGVPAAPAAANGGPRGATYYATPAQLAGLVAQYRTHPRFGGVMMWSAGFSDANVNAGCTYAQEVHAILAQGAPCARAPLLSSVSVATSTSTMTTTTTTTGATAGAVASSATGTPVPQWAQFGGTG